MSQPGSLADDRSRTRPYEARNILLAFGRAYTAELMQTSFSDQPSARRNMFLHTDFGTPPTTGGARGAQRRARSGRRDDRRCLQPADGETAHARERRRAG